MADDHQPMTPAETAKALSLALLRVAELEAMLESAIDHIDKPSDTPGATLIVLAGRKVLESSRGAVRAK